MKDNLEAQRQRLIKIYVKIINRLPERYIKTYIQFFNTTEEMLKDLADSYNESLEGYKDYYNNYLQTTANYTKTKYFRRTKIKTWDHISALSGNPISLSLEKCKKYQEYEFAFLLLHEIGHNSGHREEKDADIFACRWIRKLIKEGIICFPKSL